MQIVEDAMIELAPHLKKYRCAQVLPNGVVVHLFPLGDTGYVVGTFTAYNADGLKSEKALPFSKFMRLVEELEKEILPKFRYPDGFAGWLVGWNVRAFRYIDSFLLRKKVHRVFFLHESDVYPFLKAYTDPIRVKRRLLETETDVVVMFG